MRACVQCCTASTPRIVILHADIVILSWLLHPICLCSTQLPQPASSHVSARAAPAGLSPTQTPHTPLNTHPHARGKQACTVCCSASQTSTWPLRNQSIDSILPGVSVCALHTRAQAHKTSCPCPLPLPRNEVTRTRASKQLNVMGCSSSSSWRS